MTLTVSACSLVHWLLGRLGSKGGAGDFPLSLYALELPLQQLHLLPALPGYPKIYLSSAHPLLMSQSGDATVLANFLSIIHLYRSSTFLLPYTQARQWGPVSQLNPTQIDSDGPDEFQIRAPRVRYLQLPRW